MRFPKTKSFEPLIFVTLSIILYFLLEQLLVRTLAEMIRPLVGSIRAG